MLFLGPLLNIEETTITDEKYHDHMNYTESSILILKNNFIKVEWIKQKNYVKIRKDFDTTYGVSYSEITLSIYVLGVIPLSQMLLKKLKRAGKLSVLASPSTSIRAIPEQVREHRALLWYLYGEEGIERYYLYLDNLKLNTVSMTHFSSVKYKHTRNLTDLLKYSRNIQIFAKSGLIGHFNKHLMWDEFKCEYEHKKFIGEQFWPKHSRNKLGKTIDILEIEEYPLEISSTFAEYSFTRKKIIAYSWGYNYSKVTSVHNAIALKAMIVNDYTLLRKSIKVMIVNNLHSRKEELSEYSQFTDKKEEIIDYFFKYAKIATLYYKHHFTIFCSYGDKVRLVTKELVIDAGYYRQNSKESQDIIIVVSSQKYQKAFNNLVREVEMGYDITNFVFSMLLSNDTKIISNMVGAKQYYYSLVIVL